MWRLFNYLVGNQTLQFLNQGIVRALQEYQQQLIKHKVTIFVRRGGPNYQEGLRVMREVGKIYCIFFKELFV
jgi:succinyl-CoA synthetase beta subunit